MARSADLLRAVCVFYFLTTVTAARGGSSLAKETAKESKQPQVPNFEKVDKTLVGDDTIPQEKPKEFWYNSATGESLWSNPTPVKHTDDDGNEFYSDPSDPTITWWAVEPPEAWAWEEVPVTEGENVGKTYYHNKVTNAVEWDAPAMLSWKKMSSERVFYYNQITGETKNDRPVEMGFWSNEHNRTYWLDDKGEPTWESKYWWTQVPVEGTSEAEKRWYYVNEMTKESSWEVPADIAWVQWHEEL